MARITKRTMVAALFAPLLVVVWQGWRSVRSELAAFNPPRGPVARPESLDGLDGMRDVRIAVTAGGAQNGAPGTFDVAAWWVPPRNGAAVVLAHGSFGTRASMLAEARALGKAGFGVLLFDWPGHGESGGEV